MKRRSKSTNTTPIRHSERTRKSINYNEDVIVIDSDEEISNSDEEINDPSEINRPSKRTKLVQDPGDAPVHRPTPTIAPDSDDDSDIGEEVIMTGKVMMAGKSVTSSSITHVSQGVEPAQANVPLTQSVQPSMPAYVSLMDLAMVSADQDRLRAPAAPSSPAIPTLPNTDTPPSRASVQPNEAKEAIENALRETIANLTKANESLEKDKRSFESESKALKDAKESAVNELREMVEKLKKENAALMENKRSLESESKVLKDAKEAVENERSATIEKLEQEKKSLERKNDSLESEKRGLEYDSSQLRKTLKKMLEENERIESERIKILDNDLANILEIMLEEKKDLKEELNDLAGFCEAILEDREVLKKELAKKQQTDPDLGQTLEEARLEQENARLEQELAKMQDSEQDLVDALTKMPQEIARLEQELVQRQKKDRDLEQALAEMREENELLKQERTKAQKKDQGLEKTLERTRQESDRLKQELTKAQDRGQALESMQQEMERLRQELKRKQQNEEGLGRELARTQLNERLLKQALEEMRKENDHLKQELVKKQTENAGLLHKNGYLKNALAKKAQTDKELRATLEHALGKMQKTGAKPSPSPSSATRSAPSKEKGVDASGQQSSF